ncbi:MAG: hypothetical protein GX444_14105 [Myxococcales bacterium]|nr:hypothetical protein [Myxococcales bacterium]
MKSPLFRLSLFAILFAILAVGGCVDPVSVDEAGPCDNNRAPHVRNLSLVVDSFADGDLSGLNIIEPNATNGLYYFSKKDRVVVWFEFKDADCNLDGGEIYWAMDADNFVPVEDVTLADSDSCSGLQFWQFLHENVDLELPRGYGYEIPVTKLSTLGCGQHTFTIGIKDACDQASQEALTAGFFIPYSDCTPD